MKKQPQVTERTKAMLCKAFWSMYRARPIEKITVREITEKAGYNRGTFYLYYRDVRDMFSQIEDSLLDMIDELVADMLVDEDRIDIESNMGVILKAAKSHSRYMSVLLGDKGDPTFVTRMKTIIWPLVDRYLGITQSPDMNDDERELLKEFYLSGLMAAVTSWLKMADRMPIDRFITFILNTVFPAVNDQRQRTRI
ncbi:TetR/AcrR family transcriptional regulator [Bifidobacterium tissieri]|uniref:TetR/AcrR family transcriptional regulator n=1 Tax=Bifidobacterium tissieri TaxID=1630162 RepID=A0A5M9ZYF2_9BIFI|nr:TetR/AcrR family transcriptional regulator [Bifidobacterium tissieri]KAA8831503.1 TetR/AcrR family transcriptional regulator [Bifidobacterium tissieri]KAA8832469.1 TetR/AcrR family transcriptional regulator [Bifidobacterium tissieri]